ncbi:MAG: metallophosphoesterase family protein [Methanobacteriota archaeon]
MKVGIISDIHANAIGLASVLKMMGEVDMVVNCGDFTGFHTEVNEAMDRFRGLHVDSLSVLGNHDSYLLRGAPSGKDEKIKKSAEYSRGKISPENMRFLRGLSPTLSTSLGGRKALICHGSPWDPLEEYIYPDSKRFPDFQNIKEEIVIMGHTHYPLLNNDSGKTIINPGSVGQPRGANKKATFALMDTTTMAVEIRDVDCYPPAIWGEITIGGARKSHMGVG